jgi:exonuclease III
VKHKGIGMRILSWNCYGAFRRKFHLLDSFDADVLVIQECEEPNAASVDYQTWAGNYLWVGASKHKGIGIFVKGGHKLEKLDWPSDKAALFLPVQINDTIQLVGVWTQAAKSSSSSYVGQLWQYLKLNQKRLNSATIFCGDFNSNKQWDKPRGLWSHSKCVADFSDLGIVSLYHEFQAEAQGEETRPTFYLHRNKLKPFHIDYAFAHESFKEVVQPNFWIGEPDIWLQYSDHMPLVFDI